MKTEESVKQEIIQAIHGQLAMPTSHHVQLNEIVELIILTNPKKLLDIGVGFGKYGFLAREYLELWDGRETYHEWQRQIDGIEAFEAYLSPVHRHIYNTIHIGDAAVLLPKIREHYDLILLIDVLEHFDHAAGLQLLGECRKQGRNIIVSVPKSWFPQGTAFDNQYETHRFYWKKKHFGAFRDKSFIPNPESIICYIGEDWRIARTKRRWLKVRRKLVRILEYLRIKGTVKRLVKRNMPTG